MLIMNSKRTFILIIAIVLSAAAAGHVSPARAALCGKCREMMFTESQGRCIDCGGPTSSGALQLCPKCSAKRHQCEHCLAKLSEKDETAVEPPHRRLRYRANASNGDAEKQPPPLLATPGNADPAPRDDGRTARRLWSGASVVRT